MIVYIPYSRDGVECWRPAEAEHVSGDSYRIVATKPLEEHWLVSTGEVVRCEHRRFSDGFEGLVAILPSAPTHLPPIY